MASFTISIANSLLLCGLEQTTKYGAATFGTSKWTIGSFDLDTETIKLIANSLVPDTANLFDAIKLIDNSLVFAFETSSEGLNDGRWDYAFTRPTSEAENRNLASFASLAGATTAWTTALVGSGVWS